MTRKITAIGYGRVSNPGSTEAQANAIRDYAESRSMDLVVYYADDGLTGTTLERPGLEAMIRDIAQGRAKIVIVEDIDRLGRDQEHLHHLEKLFSCNDAVLHTLSCGGPVDDLGFGLKGI